MTTRAVGYIRVSTEKQAELGVSLDMQAERIRAYCQMIGVELTATITDDGVSAGIPLAQRPGGSALMAAMKQHKVAHVVALKLDRLFRDAADALNQTKAWDKAGVALHLVDVGGQTINTSTAMGRMFLTMMAGFAELERNLIKERTSAALRHMQAHGEYIGGGAPYGFDLTEDGALIENPAEQAVIAEARRLREAGMSLRAVAAELDGRGLRSRNGIVFAAQQIKRMVA